MFKPTAKQIALGAGSAIMFLVPVAADHTPGELFENLVKFKLIFFGLAIVGALCLAYEWGKANGQGAAESGQSTFNTNTIKSVIYSVRELESIMLDAGNCRADAARNLIQKLGREHHAWHHPETLAARNAFLTDVRKALEVRERNGNRMTWTVGDYDPKQRRTFTGMLTQRARILVEKLQAQDN